MKRYIKVLASSWAISIASLLARINANSQQEEMLPGVFALIKFNLLLFVCLEFLLG
jgi:nitrogen fixation/metabolism regulation signal transduction histidine kinase